MIAILLLATIIFLAYKAAPREKQEHTLVHGAGQIGLSAAVALFGVDYFTSYYYASGELLGALHPYGLEHYAYIAVVFIAFANIVFGVLYMYALGIFNEGGGSFTAAMRYLGPSLSLIVAVVLIQDYVFTIVVSTLSGADQLLSLRNAAGTSWLSHFLIGAALASITWYITIRGRGESAQVVFIWLVLFVVLTLIMVGGLFAAAARPETVDFGAPTMAGETAGAGNVSIWSALYHLLAASMKGLVALSGLEAMSNGIQFVIDEDAAPVKWGRKHLPRLKRLWDFYSGKTGIGRFVQTSFLFYGGLTTLMLTAFAIHFDVYDGTYGRSLVGNLAYIGFGQLPDGRILFWAYQILAVILLSAASMTAYQDLQAMAWRNVAIGEIPEIIVYRNPKGTFTRPVTASFIATVIIQLLVQGETSHAVPYYGVGVFMPIMAMGLAMRRHILQNYSGWRRLWGSLGAGLAAGLAAFIFIGQIVGKWTEGGWIVLISLIVLILIAHAILISPIGYRDPNQIYRIVRVKSRVRGPIGAIVEWQSLRAQEYRYQLLIVIARFAELFGIRRPVRFEPPIPAGDYEAAANASEHTVSLLAQYLESQPKAEPRLGGPPPETAAAAENDLS